jgi:hypothetical protein
MSAYFPQAFPAAYFLPGSKHGTGFENGQIPAGFIG